MPAPEPSSLPVRHVAGPEPPKSWTKSATVTTSEADATSRRARALSLVFSHLTPSRCSDSTAPSSASGHVPPLTLLCLRRLLVFLAAPDFIADVVPHVPAHLRHALIRHCAVHEPLPSAVLYALYEPAGHADGELIVTGPQASLRSGHFTSSSATRESWDAAVTDETPLPLTTLVLYSTSLSVPTLLTVPASLTHLALLALPRAVPLHRLPGLCPLLAVLDLSYDAWLDIETLLGVGWRRWSRLRVLGLRDCGFKAEEVEQVRRAVNLGRWEDVEIILR